MGRGENERTYLYRCLGGGGEIFAPSGGVVNEGGWSFASVELAVGQD